MSQTLTGNQYAILDVFRDQFIKGAERGLSILKDQVTTDYVNSGGTYTFLVADSGAATAVTRSLNGQIPGYVNNNVQKTITLAEWHAAFEATDFNIFESQGPQADILRMNALNTLGRKVDSDIFTALDTTTLGIATTASQNVLDMMTKGQGILGKNDFRTDDGNICAVVSTAFFARMKAVKEFGNIEWANKKAFEEGIPNQQRLYDWNGTKILVHNGVPGVGTSSEKNFIFHKDAVGFALDKLDVSIGYDTRHRYSFAIGSAHMGAKVLQTNGVVEMLHDASDYAAATIS